MTGLTGPAIEIELGAASALESYQSGKGSQLGTGLHI